MGHGAAAIPFGYVLVGLVAYALAWVFALAIGRRGNLGSVLRSLLACAAVATVISVPATAAVVSCWPSHREMLEPLWLRTLGLVGVAVFLAAIRTGTFKPVRPVVMRPAN